MPAESPRAPSTLTSERDPVGRPGNESVAWEQWEMRSWQSGPWICRADSELNLSIRPRSGSRRCRRLRPMNNDGPRHRRTGSCGPDRDRIVVGRRLRETACQYRFRWRSLVWAHRLGDGRRLRRCCRLKPSARYKPSRRGPFISSVGRGRRGQAAHNCCHSGC